MTCVVINNSNQYKKLRDEKQHLAHRSGLPDHMINTIAIVMKGRKMDEDIIPQHAKNVYNEQTRVGWRNMIMGRISYRWSKVKTKDCKGRLETGKLWCIRAIKVILGWLHEKWILRCQMYQEPGEDLEHKALYEKCMEWWRAREIKGLLRGGAHLRNHRQKPRSL